MKLTREEAKQMLPIIQAWADGKTVDWYDEDIGWRASGFTLDFDKNPKYFRVNSEAESESKYRPFKSQEECLDEMMKHQPFGWVKWNDVRYNIYVVSSTSVCLINGNCENMDFAYAYQKLTFADGTPFGVKEE